MTEGDYVRTKNKAPFEPSQIAKITDMKKDEGYKNQYFITLDHNLPTTYNFHIYSEDVIKSSPNIIDLIEVGDYINGKHVDKYQGKLGVFCELPNGKWEFIELTNEHYLISSIVTKEQFSCMEYKIGEYVNMSEEYGLKFVVNGEDYDKIKKSLNEQIEDLQQKVEQLENENEYLKMSNPEQNIEHFRIVNENKRRIDMLRKENHQLENIRKDAIEELSYMSTDAYVEDYDIREKHYNLLMNILSKGG